MILSGISGPITDPNRGFERVAPAWNGVKKPILSKGAPRALLRGLHETINNEFRRSVLGGSYSRCTEQRRHSPIGDQQGGHQGDSPPG
ncbi:hypothetical protein BN873_980107 [Candidatus Competibacter denitrificans Run_A_D11]|uniref:Uncharacterized protein n=1 Tax=Candidatus Competibacter denitrificans Run_A_D11 TaxID=1400863 RepID=W6M919_9GAMM|nr:hypothetical protein BN873_980107 [Candidatus Competibacter denitrificans Run_A_D11]